VDSAFPRVLVNPVMSNRSVIRRIRSREKETSIVALEVTTASRFYLEQQGVCAVDKKIEQELDSDLWHSVITC
jgi:hypothetical protein